MKPKQSPAPPVGAEKDSWFFSGFSLGAALFTVCLILFTGFLWLSIIFSALALLSGALSVHYREPIWLPGVLGISISSGVLGFLGTVTCWL